MKIYALFTLHKTGWGTRAGIGDPATATTAAANDTTAEKTSQGGLVPITPPSQTDGQRDTYDVEMGQNARNPYRP